MHGWGYYKFKTGMNIMDNGKMIKWKEKESTLQQQVIATRIFSDGRLDGPGSFRSYLGETCW